MSSLFISSSTQLCLTSIAEKFVVSPNTVVKATEHETCSSVVSRVDDIKLWGESKDEETGITVLLGGRIALNEAEWKSAESLPYTGGLACSWLLDRWLKTPENFINNVNGAFLIIIINESRQQIDVFTDRLGMFPSYFAPSYPLMLCSHPDILADVLISHNYQCELDWTTIAEVISTANAVHPNTYYKSIKSLDAGSHYHWKSGQSSTLTKINCYWQPAYIQSDTTYDDQQMVDELVVAIKKAVQRRTLERFGSSAVLLSGGVDSRAILFGADKPSKMTAITLFDEENEELAVAQKLSRIAEASHISLKRGNDYYAENAEWSVKTSGGMWSILDSHYSGVTETIRKKHYGTILSGCYADYMFKGLLLNRCYHKLFGRTLPLFKTSVFDFQYYHSHETLSKEWQEKIQQRLNKRYPEYLRNDYQKNALIIEDLRLRPLIREADTSGRAILWQTLPWDHLLSDLDILKVYEKLSTQQKINGVIFGKAVANIVGKDARKVPNNNVGAPVDVSKLLRILYFLKGVLKRKIQRLSRKNRGTWRLATSGSWPNWSYYIAHSKGIAELWNSQNKDINDFFNSVLGYNPKNKKIEEWAKDKPILFIRLLTIKIWLEQRKSFF